jgi:protein SCO1/2
MCLLGWNASVARAHGDEKHDNDNPTNDYSKKLLKQVGIDQKLDEQVPVNLTFRNESGKEVRLGQYLGDKPAMVLMLSYACTQLCTAELEALVYTLKDLSFPPGKEFNLLVVGIGSGRNTRDGQGQQGRVHEKV